MSTSHSLYVQIPIAHSDLAAVLDSPASPCELNDNWRAWWTSRDILSNYELIDIPIYRQARYRDIVDNMTTDGYMLCKSWYDSDTQYWHVVALQFAENYIETLPFLAFIHDLAKHSQAGRIGHAVLFDYLWSDKHVMAYLKIEDQEVHLSPFRYTGELPDDFIETARNALSAWMGELHHQGQQPS